MILSVFFFGILAGILSASENTVTLLTLGLIILFVVPSISLNVRRLHDMNRSGWWLLLNSLPLVGGIMFLALCFLKGTDGNNDFD